MEKQIESRDYSLDNLKAILMVCIVMIHAVLSIEHGRILSITHQFMLIFAIPCFVFVSGYFAKGVMRDGGFRISRVFSMLWLYLFFKIAWYILEYFCNGEAELDLFDATSSPWYLLAMAFWYLLVPVLKAFPQKYVLIITFLIGVFSGYCEWFSTFLSLSRVLVYLPFFAAGLLLEREQMEAFTKRNLRFPAVVILTILILMFVMIFDKIWFYASLYYGEYPYAQIMSKELFPYGWVVRVIVFLLASIIGACLLAIVPKRKVFFTYVGKNTLAVYILHALLRNLLKYMGVFTWVNEKYTKEQMLWIVPIVIATTLFLGNALFGAVFQFITNPFKFIKHVE